MKKEKHQEIIYGINPIMEALQAKRRRIRTIYTTKPFPKAWKKIASLLSKHIDVRIVDRPTLSRIAESTEHQSFVAFVSPFPFYKKLFEPTTHPLLLLLDGIQDPRNLGALIRSAYCTGFDGVILPQKGCAVLSPTALKASAGLAEHMSIYHVASVNTAVAQLKQKGYTLYVATFDGRDATEVVYALPLCLVIGSEGVGVSPVVAGEGTAVTLPQRTQRPQREGDTSYNASVAGGILMFLIAQQHQKGGVV